MSGILTLAAAGALGATHGHRVLAWLASRGAHPTVVLTGWMVAVTGLVASAVAFLALLALPTDAHPSTGLFELAGGCWAALSSGALPAGREAVAGASTALAGTVALRVAWASRGRASARRAVAPARAQLRQLASTRQPDRLIEIRDDRPLAMAIAGRPGIVVISDGLRRRLTDQELAATLAHEHAHLRGRHHVLIAITEVLAQALPCMPLLRAAPEAVRDLVELAADCAAVRRCGAPAVHAALTRVTDTTDRIRPGSPGSADEQTTPTATGGALAMTGHGLHMASRLTALRLRRLVAPARLSSPVPRALACAAMAATALLLPMVTGWFLVNTVGCVVA